MCQPISSEKNQRSSWLDPNSIIQIAILVMTFTACLIAYNAWTNEVEKRKFETTLKFAEPLTDKEFINSLWALQEFTTCFENRHNQHAAKTEEKFTHLSYIFANELEHLNTVQIESLAVAWWKAVENRGANDPCKKETMDRYNIPDIEFELFRVYSRISNLATCLNHSFCDGQLIEKLSLEAMDGISPAAIANYLRLASNYSREWDLGRNAPGVLLIDKISEYNSDLIYRSRKRIWDETNYTEQSNGEGINDSALIAVPTPPTHATGSRQQQ